MTRPTYRVTIEMNEPRTVPDRRSDRPKFWRVDAWHVTNKVEGDEKVVAATLRALADQLDPPKKPMREVNLGR